MSNIRLRKGHYRPLSDIDCANRPLGQILLDAGRISAPTLARCLDAQTKSGVRLGEVLVASGAVSAATLTEALARQKSLPYRLQRGTQPAFTDDDPWFWIKAGIVPWGKIDTIWQVAAKDDETYRQYADEIHRRLGRHQFIWSTQQVIERHLETLFRAQLIPYAETGRIQRESCVSLRFDLIKGLLIGIFLCVALGFILVPVVIYGTLLTLGAIVLALSTLHKLYLFLRIPATDRRARPLGHPEILPKITVLVPLFKEKDIAAELVKRLEKLTYSRAHLDVILILEQADTQTSDMLRRQKLPHWMRILRVPKGQVQTKPRAMNYALPFCHGDIIGIYDAEDAPDPDQLNQVAAQFAAAAPDVACLQGSLDFYNSHSNWLARCFTIEYNTWFKAVLPALALNNQIVPLGGTTLFFRRTILEDLGAWDAFNVTEDCDLGVRLSRRGYRCEILRSTTSEEANNLARPWIKQRSRWIKGYYITYFTHMRDIKQLVQDLGWTRFWHFQMLFLPTLILLPIAPVFWAMWGVFFGLFSNVTLGLSHTQIIALSGVFIVSFSVDTLGQVLGVLRSGHTRLLPWIITTYFYFPMATFASYKALFELCTAPFYWDKTMHGRAMVKPPLNPALDASQRQ